MLKDGDDYYLTWSSFEATPGLQILHSRDLVNWTPIGPALERPIATVFAVDIAKHDDRFFIYIPFIPAPWAEGFGTTPRIFVISAHVLVSRSTASRSPRRAASPSSRNCGRDLHWTSAATAGRRASSTRPASSTRRRPPAAPGRSGHGSQDRGREQRRSPSRSVLDMPTS